MTNAEELIQVMLDEHWLEHSGERFYHCIEAAIIKCRWNLMWRRIF